MYVCALLFEVESLHHICNAAENTKKERRGGEKETHVTEE